MQTEIKIIFTPSMNEDQKREVVMEKINRIEQEGGYIIEDAPIEKIFVTIIGRKLTVEY